jgi:hypothetical protein
LHHLGTAKREDQTRKPKSEGRKNSEFRIPNLGQRLEAGINGEIQ